MATSAHQRWSLLSRPNQPVALRTKMQEINHLAIGAQKFFPTPGLPGREAHPRKGRAKTKVSDEEEEEVLERAQSD